MRRLVLSSSIALLAVGGWVASARWERAAAAEAVATTALEARVAVDSALPILQASIRTWTEDIACYSCHHQGLGTLGMAFVEELGFEIDLEQALGEADEIRELSRERYEALLVCDGVGVFGRGTTLIALAARTRPRDDVTDVVASFLAARQAASGVWYSNEHRPPFEDSHVSATVLTMRGLQLYGPEGRAEEMRARLARAQAWLESVEPKDNEERSMQLLGLAWCEADSARIKRDAAALLQQQRADGGWAQAHHLESDAYATGQALVVLNQAARVAVSDSAWQRGARFLLDDQRADGTWYVESRRRIKGLKMVDSGFPYERDQFISFMGTQWATMALALSGAGTERTQALFGSPPERDLADTTARENGLTELQRVAAFGSAAKLRALLEAGADCDEAGPRELTALMLAVHDPTKVELLLQHGADPHAVSGWGFTPLLFATMTSGAGPMIERFLELGAAVDVRATNGASPLYSALSMSDRAMIEPLLEAGASLKPRHMQNALVYAATCNDLETARLLLDLGVDIDGPGIQSHTALISAAIGGFEELLELLLEAGADVEACDSEGMTALAWASKIDPGHSRIVERLMRAGADANTANEKGFTPIAWARRYKIKGHLDLLLPARVREEP